MKPQSNPSALTADAEDEPAGRPIPEHPEALLYPAEVAFLMGVSHRTLEAARLKGGGVPYIRLGRRCIRYRRRDVLAWIASRQRRSTSDPGPAADTPARAEG